MTNVDRRSFLGASLGGIAGAMSCVPTLLAQSAIETAGLDTLFLTWQRDPTTSVAIQWVGAVAAPNAFVYYGELTEEIGSRAAVRTRPYPETNWQVHRCELTGLRPGTEYQFRLSCAPETYRFRTMPAKATDAFQFVSGGDSGIDQHAIRTNILAAQQEPYFALIAGDLAYDNGKDAHTFLAFLRNYHRHMVDAQGRLIPMISCIGNHEVKGGYKAKRTDAPYYLSVFDGLFKERTYDVIDVGDYLSLVLLDTGHIAPIGGEQTDWLEKTLADRQERPHLIVANHVPAYPSYRAPEGNDGTPGTGAENRKHWSPLFERYNVDVVLEHHDHTFKRTHPLTNGLYDKNGVLYLGDGSWGKLRIPNSPEKRPYLASVSSSYHLSVHRLEGKQCFHVALDSSGKVADVCLTLGKRPARRG
jgi:hypothetical protein